MKFEILYAESATCANAGWYFLLNSGWVYFSAADLTAYSLGKLRKTGYTHYYTGRTNPGCWPAALDDRVPKRDFDELREAHKKALERLTNQERDHQAQVKKFKERIRELELQSLRNSNLGVIVSENRYDDLLRCEGHLRDRTAERDAARKTLADVRDLLNGITP